MMKINQYDLHHRTATKIRNLAEIRNSINALKVRKL